MINPFNFGHYIVYNIYNLIGLWNEDCPIRKSIPTELVVLGALGLFLVVSCTIFICGFKTCVSTEMNCNQRLSRGTWVYLISFSILVGSVFITFIWALFTIVITVFGSWDDWRRFNEINPEKSCHRGTYLFAFAISIYLSWLPRCAGK